MNFFTANTVAKYAMVDIATDASKVVKLRNPATTPGRWFNPSQNRAKQTVSNQQLRRMNFQEVADDDDIDLYAAPDVLPPLDPPEVPEQAASSSVAEPPNAAEPPTWRSGRSRWLRTSHVQFVKV